MDLSEQDLKKIKSLHVMLKMPIWILERETNRVLKSYKSIYKHPISYEFKEKNISDEVVRFYSGMLNEIFLCLWYQDVRIVKFCQKKNAGNITLHFRYIHWEIFGII